MQRKFFDATMMESESAIAYVSRVQRIYSELVQIGAFMREETLVSRIVSGLNSKFHVFMTNWSNSESRRRTLAELIPRLTSEEELMARMKKTSQKQEVALISETSQNKFKPVREKSQRSSSELPNKVLDEKKKKQKMD